MGLQIAIFKISNLGLLEYFRSWSNPARLGELGGNLLPLFPINKRKGAVPNILNPPGYAFQLFWVKKLFPRREFRPRCFHNALRRFCMKVFAVLHRSSSVLRSFFGLQLVSFRIRDFQFISCFVGFYLYFVHFRYSFLPFLTCFNRLFIPLSRLINDKMNFNRSFAL